MIKILIFVCSLVLSSCNSSHQGGGSMGLNKVNCNENSTFKLSFYEVVRANEAVFSDIAKTIGELDHFIPHDGFNEDGVHDNFLGYTLEKHFKKSILEKLNAVVDPSLNVKPIWTKHRVHHSQQDREVYYLHLVKLNKHMIHAECPQILGERLTEDAGHIHVMLQFDETTGKKWYKLTERAFIRGRETIAVVFEDEVYSCPSVRSPISGNNTSVAFDHVEDGKAFIKKLRN